MFQLLLDENLPLQAAPALRAAGLKAVHAHEAGLRSAPDEEILSKASAENWICVTMDRDLHRILATTGMTSPSVLLLRHVDPIPDDIVALTTAALKQIGEEQLSFGVAATVTPKSIRIRRLPLRRPTA